MQQYQPDARQPILHRIQLSESTPGLVRIEKLPLKLLNLGFRLPVQQCFLAEAEENSFTSHFGRWQPLGLSRESLVRPCAADAAHWSSDAGRSAQGRDPMQARRAG
jgi:hypothetical protein